MRRMLMTATLAAIVFTICAAGVEAQTFNGQITVGTVIAIPGGKAILPISLSGNNINIAALTIPLKFDNSILSIDSVSFAGTLLKPNMGGLSDIENGSGFVRVTYTPPLSGSPTYITESGGLIARLFFAVNPGAGIQTVAVDSVNRIDHTNPIIWVRLEVADNSGLTLYLPTFAAGAVDIQGTLDAGDGGSALPKVLDLKQNFPNPFNPSTTISFALPARSAVNLTVYNILGQQVQNLIDGVMDAGEHTVIWNADHQASGLYFYRLTYENKVLTKKMTLLK
jgi:hypothetical protein